MSIFTKVREYIEADFESAMDSDSFLRVMGKFGKYGTGLTLGCVAAFNIGNIACADWKSGDQSRVGYVQTFGQNGLLVKTFEGSIKSPIAGSTEFAFSVRKADTDLIKEVKEAQSTQECVELSLSMTAGHRFWQQDSDTRVTAVKAIPNCSANLGIAPR